MSRFVEKLRDHAHLEVMNALIVASGENVNAQNENGETALHVAVITNAGVDCGKALLDGGLEVEKKDNCGETALTLAIKNRAPEEVVHALRSKVYIDKCMREGQIPPILPENFRRLQFIWSLANEAQEREWFEKHYAEQKRTDH